MVINPWHFGRSNGLKRRRRAAETRISRKIVEFPRRHCQPSGGREWHRDWHNLCKFTTEKSANRYKREESPARIRRRNLKGFPNVRHVRCTCIAAVNEMDSRCVVQSLHGRCSEASRTSTRQFEVAETVKIEEGMVYVPSQPDTLVAGDGGR